MKSIIIFFFFVLIFLSCGRTARLSEEDYLWMPYKGDETLVFRSSTGYTDTIFLLKKDTLWGYPDPIMSTGKYEVAAIFCKHSDPYAENDKHRYLKNYFFEIKKTGKKHAELVIDLSAKDAHFYRLSAIKTDSLCKVKPATVQTSYEQYDDVYVIEGEDYLGSFYQRSNFVTKLYWSKSNGLIRYDKKEGIYWELVKQ